MKNFFSLNSPKVFGIGRNKTGTTSLSKAMSALGFKVGNQHQAEMLIRDWAKRDFSKIEKYCKHADFFQDVPFSLPFSFQAMDILFPNSKFILTIRDSESWYESVTKFSQIKSIFGEKGNSLHALKNQAYCYKGYLYDVKTLVYEFPSDDANHRETLISHYNYHNRMVLDYFRHRKDDLLVLDLKEKNKYERLCAFLAVDCPSNDYPQENITDDFSI